MERYQRTQNVLEDWGNASERGCGLQGKERGGWEQHLGIGCPGFFWQLLGSSYVWVETERMEVCVFSAEENPCAWETWRAVAWQWEGSVLQEKWTTSSSVVAKGRGCSDAG